MAPGSKKKTLFWSRAFSASYSTHSLNRCSAAVISTLQTLPHPLADPLQCWGRCSGQGLWFSATVVWM